MYLSHEPLLDLFSFQKNLLPSEPAYRSQYYWKFMLTMINVVQVPVIFMMLMKYLRVIESLGLFILLIVECIKDVQIFLIFMFMWVFIFTIQLYILQCGVPNQEDYPMMSPSLTLLTQVWRDALGDI